MTKPVVAPKINAVKATHKKVVHTAEHKKQYVSVVNTSNNLKPTYTLSPVKNN